ncbi:unnamed protein product [Bursaphelenchus xylophilus]|uniref:(pine wood nematode) hypothetical protein n=1 Tax=Bursaphelenchus xylophilus TaxID=6326 RepID=A0A1I7SX20_BURXY|nr:unnamed protein product [Bursaphelenchus xylophilus]CAG9100118.1 unnamed protein product [Bursaphelenchus xylophilus]
MTDTKEVKSTEEKPLPKIPLASPFAKKPSFTETTGQGLKFSDKLSKPVFGSAFKSTEDKKPEDKVETPSGFVFGAKLADRVTNVAKKDGDDGPKDASSIFKKFAVNSGTGLFCKPASCSSSEESKEIKPFAGSSESKEKQVELETPAETITGEEGEVNILHVSCKFYIFDKETKSWQERGNGVLRINQSFEERQNFRIIGRATGNQRVCVNSKIFADMLLEKVSDKRLKFSAMTADSEIPQLVVIQSSPAGIAQIEAKLEELISLAKLNNRKRKLDSKDEEVASKKENGFGYNENDKGEDDEKDD